MPFSFLALAHLRAPAAGPLPLAETGCFLDHVKGDHALAVTEQACPPGQGPEHRPGIVNLTWHRDSGSLGNVPLWHSQLCFYNERL